LLSGLLDSFIQQLVEGESEIKRSAMIKVELEEVNQEVEEAKKNLESYLAYEHLEDYQKSWTLYRLGQVYAREKEWGKAYAAYEKAVKLDGHKPAKASMDRLKQRRKDGKIKF
jgi:cytochrome c-type biogenesis protein CcmH/NrfG